MCENKDGLPPIEDSELNADLQLNTKSENDISSESTVAPATVSENKDGFGKDAMPPLSNEKAIEKRQVIFKKIFTALFVILTVGVLAMTAYKDFSADNIASFSEIMSHFAKNWYYFLLAILCFVLTYVFEGLKLSFMLKATTGKFRFRLCLETAVYYRYYDYITPLGTGGQPFAIYHLSKRGVETGAALSLPLASFFFYQVGFAVLVIAGLIFNACNVLNLNQYITPALTGLAIAGLFLGLIFPTLIIVFSLMPKTCGKLVTFFIKLASKLKLVKNPDALIEKSMNSVRHNTECIKQIAKNKLVFGLSILFGILQHLALSSIAYFTLKGFSFNDPLNGFYEWSQMMIVAMLMYSAVSFVPTPGNSGAADLTFYAVFSATLVAGISFTAMITWRILCYYSYVVIGFIVVMANKRKAKKTTVINS